MSKAWVYPTFYLKVPFKIMIIYIYCDKTEEIRPWNNLNLTVFLFFWLIIHLNMFFFFDSTIDLETVWKEMNRSVWKNIWRP